MGKSKHPKSLTNEDFKLKFNNFYSNYDLNLDKCNYINANVPITFTCKEHGDQKVIPYKLFKNNLSPCPKCRKKQLNVRVTDTSTFIQKSNLIHNNKYDYSKTIYTGNLNEVEIKCLKHGFFKVKADYHLSLGIGCPKCGKENITSKKEDILNKFKIIHNNKYEYPEFDYIKGSQYIEIKCPTHGLFKQKIETHLLGHGCKKCGYNTSNTEEFIKKSIKIHGNKYNYDKSIYINNKNKIKIICPVHGEFSIFPSNHVKGEGCLKCNADERNKVHLKQFIEKSKNIHENKYDYSKSIYTGRFNNIKIICKEHGEFYQQPGVHLQGSGCPECANSKLNYSSKYENKIIDFISKNSDLKTHPRFYLGKKEIDIYLPELNTGFEFNGSYWHSHIFKDKKYHFNKKQFFKNNGIKLYFIWEHDWINPIKNKIIKSWILNKIGKTPNKIYARKCKIKIITSKEYKEFCENNHIQGYSPTTLKLGVFYNNVLIAAMGFSKLRVNLGNKKSNHNKWELVRYCTLLNTNIIGGASKLLKYFENKYNPNYLVSYANEDYSNGNMYNVLKFEDKGITNLTYSYVDSKTNKVYNRFTFRKSELIKMGYDKNDTEFNITHKMKLWRIYNSGTRKFVKNYN